GYGTRAHVRLDATEGAPMRSRIVLVAAVAGMLAAAPEIATAAPSSDTRSATGSGTNYTITVMLSQSSPEQFGFAVGAIGGTVTNASSGNATGTTTTTTTTTS